MFPPLPGVNRPRRRLAVCEAGAVVEPESPHKSPNPPPPLRPYADAAGPPPPPAAPPACTCVVAMTRAGAGVGAFGSGGSQFGKGRPFSV